MKTDWDAYYNKPYKTAKYSRGIMQKNLIDLISRFSNSNNKLCLAEFGGANSCFFDKIQEKIIPNQYVIVDNNEVGLKKIKEKTSAGSCSVVLHCRNILDLDIIEQFDLTFSVGLIEHFSIEDTKKMIQKHFDTTKIGGHVIISFPTPTFLYKITRFFAEKLGLWIFHDERPLLPNEVISTINQAGTILFRKTIWPIFLTQHIIVAIKN